jgi:hypothetical protein
MGRISMRRKDIKKSKYVILVVTFVLIFFIYRSFHVVSAWTKSSYRLLEHCCKAARSSNWLFWRGVQALSYMLSSYGCRTNKIKSSILCATSVFEKRIRFQILMI